GGATDIVLACDLRIGLQGIEWRMPATAMGLHYYPSGLARYIQRMGLAATQRAFLTARSFSWQQLEKLGLFEEFVQTKDWQVTLDKEGAASVYVEILSKHGVRVINPDNDPVIIERVDDAGFANR
ncbi:MAG: hypothetical protein ACKOD8_07630, partial [Limnohabitans sp.]